MKSADGVELTAEFFLNNLKSSREEIMKKGLDLNEELRKVPSSKRYSLSVYNIRNLYKIVFDK